VAIVVKVDLTVNCNPYSLQVEVEHLLMKDVKQLL
jgi:hypothetical protein